MVSLVLPLVLQLDAGIHLHTFTDHGQAGGGHLASLSAGICALSLKTRHNDRGRTRKNERKYISNRNIPVLRDYCSPRTEKNDYVKVYLRAPPNITSLTLSQWRGRASLLGIGNAARPPRPTSDGGGARPRPRDARRFSEGVVPMGRDVSGGRGDGGRGRRGRRVAASRHGIGVGGARAARRGEGRFRRRRKRRRIATRRGPGRRDEAVRFEVTSAGPSERRTPSWHERTATLWRGSRTAHAAFCARRRARR